MRNNGSIKMIALSCALLIILGGAGYWYFVLYAPVQYAKAALALWERFETAATRDPELTAVNFNNEKDYVGALQILQRRVTLVEKTRNELSTLRPSRTMKETHADFVFVMDGYRVVTDDAMRRAAFFNDATALTKIFQPDPPPFDNETATVRQYQDYFASAFPRAESAGDALFSKEPPPLHGDVSFSELRAQWEATKPAFPTMLAYIVRQNSVQPLKGYSPIRPIREEIRAQNTFSAFGMRLDSAFRQNTATGILSYRGIENLGGITKGEFETRSKKLETEMNNLKKRYAQ